MSASARGLLAVVLLAAAGVAGLGAGSAVAATGFGSHGTAAGQFVEPNGIAISQETGDVYIIDTNNYRVERFTKDGAFQLAWGWGVADGADALQTCTVATGCLAGIRGDGAGQVSFAEGIAVDNDPLSSSHGDVYVVDISDHRVEKFSSTGRFLLMFGGHVNASAHARGEAAGEDVCPVRPGDECTEGDAGAGRGEFEFRVEGNFISVGPTGTVYVGDRNRVEEFSPGGSYRSQVQLYPRLVGEGEAGSTIALAVDSTGDLYVIRNGVSGIQEYTPQGELLTTLNAEAGRENNESPTPAFTLGPNGQAFVDYNEQEQHRVLEFDSNGAELASFDEGMADGLHGLAYGDIAGKLYIVSAGETRVRIVTPPPLTSSVLSAFEILPWLFGP
jgi:tripartite motif-containing protein 71